MTTVALPDMQRDFDVSDDQLTWVVTAYLITFATGTVGYGRLADMHGTKRLYLFGLTLFTLASALIVIAPGYWWVVAARALQGLGGTAVPSLSMATIVRTTPPEERGRPLGATILTVGVGFGLGPLVGGALTEWWGWEAVFVGTAVASAALLAAAIWLVPAVAGRAGQSFDVSGALLVSGTITGLLIALNRLPRDVADELGLVALAASLPLAAGLALRTRHAREPYLSREVVRNRRFLALASVGFGGQATHFATVVLVPLLLARHHAQSTIEIGVLMLPGACALAITGMVGGILTSRFDARVLIVTGASVMFAGAALLQVAGMGWSPAGLSLVYVIVAAGYGLQSSPSTSSATAQLPPHLAGLGVGVYNLLFFLGGAISVAIAGAILRARADADAALNPLFSGSATEFSDAAIVVVAAAAISFALSLGLAPGRAGAPVTASGVESAPAVAGASEWPLKPRAKPNSTR